MKKAIIIRHGKTYGNTFDRYIGTTDEPLLEESRALLTSNKYPSADRVISSPLLRCRQTAQIIYPDNTIEICYGLRECDFGEFENKNHEELTENKNYLDWLESKGRMQFPGGEHPQEFITRCAEALIEQMDKSENNEVTAFVVHGGVIMAVMSALCSDEKREFYDWRVDNACGYSFCYDNRQIKDVHNL